MVPLPEQTAEMMDSEDITQSNSSSVKMDVSDERDDSAQEKVNINGDDQLATSVPSSSAGAPPAAPVLIPSLKGLMSYVGGQISCKGKWAMCDADHSNPTLTSDFEFKLVEPEDESTKFPRNGRYQGWFHIKQAIPNKPLKIEDKDMVMKFAPDADDSYTIQGQGHNVYGKFNLRGTLSKEGSAHIYREYYMLNPVSVPATTPGRRPATEKKDNSERKTKALEVKAEASTITAPSSSSTPRESSGRQRKISTLMQESIAAAATPKAQTPKSTGPPSLVPPANIRQTSNGTSGERTHRLNPAFKRCADLLKELSKLPQAAWFLEPVDPVKFNIPDYPKIIKQPMDFSTIKSNIEAGIYETVDEFAAHVRLVFRNAMTFNTDKESLVHIAAKEVGNKFEDRFRQLLAHIAPDSLEPEPTPKSKSGGSSVKAQKSSAPTVKTPRESGHHFADKEPHSKKKAAPGPRPPSQGTFIPPAAVDPSTLMILEMQKKMETMEQELNRLRASVQESQLKDRVEESVEAAKKPLTLDEKRALVTQIYKLAPEKIERALDIIRESIATNADDGEIEIPIDSLDTLTLRKLQKFIQDNTEKKKRSLGAPSLSRQSSAKGEPAPKKAKKTTKLNNGGNGSSGNLLAPEDADLALFDENEPLLFESEQLDSTPLQGHNNGGFSQHSFNDDDDDDDGNKWEQAIQEDNHSEAIV